MDFEKIAMIFTMQEPYYGILLSSMERIPTKTITPTMAVGRKGNVFKLYYNPDFTEKLNLDTVLELIKHEILHTAFNHYSIFGVEERKTATKEELFLQNVAADLEINGYLDRKKIQKEAEVVFPEDYGLDKFLGTREYYKILLQKAQQKAQAKNPQQPCNGGKGGKSQNSKQNSSGQMSQGNRQGNNPKDSKENKDSNPDKSDGNGNTQHTEGGEFPGHPSQMESLEDLKKDYKTFDDHDQWPKDMNEDEIEQMTQVIEDMLVFAAEECEKGRGKIPGEMKGRIDGIRNKKKPKPVADWKRYFRRYLGNEFTEFIRKSKKRESRRFPDAAGNRHRRKSHILVAIDTSGSVSMPEYREFFGQLKTIQASADFHVVECDARIQYEYDFKTRPNETLHGGGGTSFQQPVDLFINNKRQYDALVYFTDGYAPIPHNTPKDTLWVISSNGDQKDRKKYRVNGASVAFIPKKEN